MSKVWNDFMNSKLAQEVIAELDNAKRTKKAQAQYSDGRDRDSLYDLGPGLEPAYLSPSVETMGVSGGGGSMVGSGDSKALYTMKNVPVMGGYEDYTDGLVEGLEDKAKAIYDVAMKEPTGKPYGDSGNQALKWDGMAAHGKSVKPFTKKATEGKFNKKVQEEFRRQPEESEGQGQDSQTMDREGNPSKMVGPKNKKHHLDPKPYSEDDQADRENGWLVDRHHNGDPTRMEGPKLNRHVEEEFRRQPEQDGQPHGRHTLMVDRHGDPTKMMGDSSMMMDKMGDPSMMGDSCMMHGDDCDGGHDESLEDLLGGDGHYEENEGEDSGKLMDDDDLESLLANASGRSRKTVTLLRELVKIANELDLEGATDEANEIDAVIKTEVAALKKKVK